MAVIESKGNGYSLFNEVKLPSLPEWDKATYPYAHIAKHGDGVRYRIYLTALPLNADTELTAKLVTNTSVAVAITPLASIDDIFNSNWGSFSESEKAAGTTVINAALTVVWSNYDILNKADNSVYLAASEPISLDGMNVIEWDGDTTGLEAFPGDAKYFCVSSTTDVDVNKNCVFAIKRISAGDVIITQTTLTDGGGYWKASNRINYINTISEDYPTTGCFFITRGTQFLSIFAYYPIEPAEPEQPEEPEGGDISAGVKFLIRQIFNDAFAEVLISQMRE